jgi:hypothetical protein
MTSYPVAHSLSSLVYAEMMLDIISSVGVSYQLQAHLFSQF